MSSILESIARMGELTDYPKPQRPSLHQRYGAIARNFQDMYNQLSNTGESWATSEKNIVVLPGVDTYSLASKGDAFGKPLLLTTFSTDRNAVERAIPFFDLQNLKFDWFMPEDFAGINYFPSGGYHYAERASYFLDEDGTPKIKFLPTPMITAAYKLKYSIGNWVDKLSLNSSPIITQHHHLFEIRASKDVLYMCEWDGLKSDENQAKRREIKNNLDEQELRYEPKFRSFIKEMTHDGIVFRRAWCD